MFTNPQPETSDSQWRYQLDRFVKEHQQELAALSWALWQENGNSQGTIGINLAPTPHFVYCPNTAIEQFNVKVDNRLQEIMGLIKHHKPEVEVLMIGIGKDQVKLIYFEPQPEPPTCFTEVGKNLDTLLDELEAKLVNSLTLINS
ncbi:hypothetical protein [Calothrix sp. UHCC 0171]|uniref:beta-carboxysome assembly chaperone CcmS n=1 Tax=Calothrix sp. UHCC 0171 TaxID=3110245 RepID=UPI002B21E9CB|nr:hypothetical protein [Calothrix sp. UHCC 0171]MEA5573179.1 hypothetical protein [Calothrix sp. UHCC 0171]